MFCGTSKGGVVGLLLTCILRKSKIGTGVSDSSVSKFHICYESINPLGNIGVTDEFGPAFLALIDGFGGGAVRCGAQSI